MCCDHLCGKHCFQLILWSNATQGRCPVNAPAPIAVGREVLGHYGDLSPEPVRTRLPRQERSSPHHRVFVCSKIRVEHGHFLLTYPCRGPETAREDEQLSAHRCTRCMGCSDGVQHSPGDRPRLHRKPSTELP